ncbi:MAG: hypothetical protein GX025_09975 [Clostridiales bacterium]|nr:hypothetical protein [Clostridiales bacterium]
MTINKRYPEADTPMLTCLHAIDRAVDEMFAYNEAAGIPLNPVLVDDIKSDLFSIAITGGRPADYFNELGHGVYKECYSLFGGWIVKFASPRNNTAAEKQILEAAAEAGLSQVFLKTIFIDLPVELPADILSSDDDIIDTFLSNYSEFTCGSDTLNTMIFQPRVAISSELPDREVPCWEEEYIKDPLEFTNGIKVPYSQCYSTEISSLTWLQACIDTYGDDIFGRLCEFIDRFHLSDLHTGNIGYLITPNAEFPIILDWVSQYY